MSSLSKLLFDDDGDVHDVEKLFSTRWSPFFRGLQAAVTHPGGFAPRFDMVQKDDKIAVLAELPGMSKSDVSVTLDNSKLSICGSTKQEKDYSDADAKVTHRERSFGSFCRTISVPEGIKADEIRATMENGLLRVEMPNRSAAKHERARKIEIK